MYFSNVAYGANMRGTATPMWGGGRMMSGQMRGAGPMMAGQMRGAGPMMMSGPMRGTGPMMMSWTGQTQSSGRAAMPSTYANPQRGIQSTQGIHRGTSIQTAHRNNLQQATVAAAYQRQSNIPGYW